MSESGTLADAPPADLEDWAVASRYVWVTTGNGGRAISESRGEAGRFGQVGMRSTEGTFRAAGKYDREPNRTEITGELLMRSCEGGREPEQLDFGTGAQASGSECSVFYSVFEPYQVVVFHSGACMERQAQVPGWPWM